MTEFIAIAVKQDNTEIRVSKSAELDLKISKNSSINGRQRSLSFDNSILSKILETQAIEWVERREEEWLMSSNMLPSKRVS